jgi:hypothetical protein
MRDQQGGPYPPGSGHRGLPGYALPPVDPPPLASWGRRDPRPPGGGAGVARFTIRHALANATCGVDTAVTYLAPLWDDRNRTVDARIMQTLVVHPPSQP